MKVEKFIWDQFRSKSGAIMIRDRLYELKAVRVWSERKLNKIITEILLIHQRNFEEVVEVEPENPQQDDELYKILNEVIGKFWQIDFRLLSREAADRRQIMIYCSWMLWSECIFFFFFLPWSVTKVLSQVFCCWMIKVSLFLSRVSQTTLINFSCLSRDEFAYAPTQINFLLSLSVFSDTSGDRTY